MAFALKNILISDEVDPKCVEILKNNGIGVVNNTGLSKEQLIQEIGKYDGLIVRSATKVTAEVIQAAHNLKIIGRAGTGVDNIDCDAATKHGVIVMNTPGGNTLSAAEHTCTMLLCMSRQIANGTASMREGKWERKKFMGNEVYGKTLAIIGLGRIGKEVALRMQSFGMTTIGFDPIIPAEVAAEFNVEWLPLEQIWQLADYVTVHTPLIPQTANLLNDEVFSKCKRGIRVINCARGGIIDEAALLRALNAGQCAGAALDVFLEEPPKNLDLVRHPLVTSTPHLGASTVEAQSRVAEEIAQQFVDLSNGVSLFGAINAQALTNALSLETKPWIELGTSLGALAASLTGTQFSNAKVQIVTSGDKLQKAGTYMGAAVLVGALRSDSSNGLNLVSAPALAKQLGVKVLCEHVSGNEQVKVIVEQAEGGRTELTAVLSGDVPTLTAINGSALRQGANLKGNLVIYSTKSNGLPNIIGNLMSAGSNVVAFSVSEESQNGYWGIIKTDNAVGNLNSIKELVTSVVQLNIS